MTASDDDKMDIFLQTALGDQSQRQQNDWQQISKALDKPADAVPPAASKRSRAQRQPRQQAKPIAFLSPTWIALAAALLLQVGFALWWIARPQPDTANTDRQLMADAIVSLHAQPAKQAEYGAFYRVADQPVTINFNDGSTLQLLAGEMQAPLTAIDRNWHLLHGHLTWQIPADHQQRKSRYCRTAQALITHHNGSMYLKASRFRTHALSTNGRTSIETPGGVDQELEHDKPLSVGGRDRISSLSKNSFAGIQPSLAETSSTANIETPIAIAANSTHTLTARPQSASYTLHLEITPSGPTEALALSFPWQDEVCTAIVGGWRNTRHGFNLVGGNGDLSNRTANWLPAILASKKSQHVAYRVRPDWAAIYVNGQLLSVIDPQTPRPEQHELKWPANMRDHSGDLELTTWTTAYTIDSASIVLDSP